MGPLLLAEIYDKMPSVFQLWAIMLFFACPFLIGLTHKWLAWALLPIGLAFSVWCGYASYYEAFIEPGVSDAVQSELGLCWSIHSIASSFLPAAIASVIVVWWSAKRPKRLPNQGIQQAD